MMASSAVVAIRALMRKSSVVITSSINARWKSADTPVSWSFFPLPQSPAIPSPVIPDAYGRRLGFSVIRFARNNEWTHRTTFLLLALIASIERPTEARHGDRHRHQHQCNEC